MMVDHIAAGIDAFTVFARDNDAGDTLIDELIAHTETSRRMLKCVARGA